MLALGAHNCSNGALARAAGRPQTFQWFEAAPWRTELLQCCARARGIGTIVYARAQPQTIGTFGGGLTRQSNKKTDEHCSLWQRQRFWPFLILLCGMFGFGFVCLYVCLFGCVFVRLFSLLAGRVIVWLWFGASVSSFVSLSGCVACFGCLVCVHVCVFRCWIGCFV